MQIEYIKGIPFEKVLVELDILTMDQTRFYAALILMMLRYLHDHYIIYRDLKPENIICDHKGYLKLIDMGTAKILNSNSDSPEEAEKGKGEEINPERTFTLVGTPQYMAPEVAREAGYSYSADYWSLGMLCLMKGIVLFEIACGYVPFGADENDPFNMYEIIQSSALEFPEDITDHAFIDLISQLLNKSPESRLTIDSTRLMAHDFFAGVQMEELLQMKIDPPYIPDLTIEMATEHVSLKEGLKVERFYGRGIWL